MVDSGAGQSGGPAYLKHSGSCFPLARLQRAREAGRLMSSATSDSVVPWRAGWHAARANLGPAIVLQACALALVVAYYRHAPTRATLGALMEFRARTGAFFGIVSTGVFGGLIPLLYLRSRAVTRQRYTWT